MWPRFWQTLKQLLVKSPEKREKPMTLGVYKLEPITDDPRFEGFAFVRDDSLRGVTFLDKVDNVIRPSPLDWDFGPEIGTSLGRAWTVPPLAPFWTPQPVVGRVQSFNDYPSVTLNIPAFSRRAVDALRDFLEPNGELLPLVSPVGEYYAYNTRTVADILDQERSEIDWLTGCEAHTYDNVFQIRRYEFLPDKIAELSIFRLVEKSSSTFVTQAFVDRVQEHELQGFHFIKLWPLPEGVRWYELDEKERKKKARVKTKRGVKPVIGNTVVLRFPLTKAKPSKAEKNRLAKIMDEIDALLYDPQAKKGSAFLGSLEGDDVVEGEIRLFLSCPDADVLVEKMRPWLANLSWKHEVKVLKRYGEFHDVNCREEYVEL